LTFFLANNLVKLNVAVGEIEMIFIISINFIFYYYFFTHRISSKLAISASTSAECNSAAQMTNPRLNSLVDYMNF